ncbi:MAG TPA: hypothetical protein VI603_02340 [Saprospiraceae bacterium]|nr:hypothetical protein [Saprospiraceae bacterium]
MHHVDYNAIRLIRYSKLIDKAILAHRYSLATHLAYRCLLEYHRLFARFLMPQTKIFRHNAFQLSVMTVRYMRTRRKLTLHRTRQLFNMLRSTYFITKLSGARYADRDLHVDLATATYARDQALAISRFLFGTLNEETRGEKVRE